MASDRLTASAAMSIGSWSALPVSAHPLPDECCLLGPVAMLHQQSIILSINQFINYRSILQIGQVLKQTASCRGLISRL